jgi:hypothetical protein
MFYGCSKLNYIKMLATNISATSCLSNWVYNVSPTGTFVKNISATWTNTGSSGVPSGWTVKVNYTPTECTSLVITADNVNGNDTTTTIHWSAETIGVDDKNNPYGQTVTINGTAISESFE